MPRTRKTAKIILALVLILSMAFPMAMPSQASQKMSNPDKVGTGVIDGLADNEAYGQHNSYIWSTELFHQDDGDYIWAGTTRDMGGGITTVVNGMNESLGLDFNALIGIPPIDIPNYKGRIYRQRVGDNTNEWEVMYENPLVVGWRRMIVFNGDLYVVTGTTHPSPRNYAVILRFRPDFKKGDQPDIVYWDRIPEENSALFRAACVLDDKLYIGTFDTRVFVTDGNFTAAELTAKTVGYNYILKVMSALIQGQPAPDPTMQEGLAQAKAVKEAGWSVTDLRADFADDLGKGRNAIWDMIGFNGYLYAFLDSSSVSSAGLQGDWGIDSGESAGGFTVYKMEVDSQSGGITSLTQLVGDKDIAISPASMGVGMAMGCSPFYAEFEGEEYIYVTTLIGGAYFLTALGVGEVGPAMEYLFFPTQIYRFDKDDNWEVVVGEKDGPRAARYSDGTLIPHIGSQRGGFFPGEDSFENACANQYSWWMAQHEGKLYVSTWDTGVFKDVALGIIGFVLTSFLSGAGREVADEMLPVIALTLWDLQDYITYRMATSGMSSTEKSDLFVRDLRLLAAGMRDGFSLASFFKFITGFWNLCFRFLFGLAPSDFVPIAKFAVSLLAAAIKHPKEISAGIEKALAAYNACYLYMNDYSNPPGFDLFCTEDGINFEPVTVDGFGDKFNYGGRVLLSTEYGLFVGTANPFNGGQYWRVDDLENGLLVNAPNKISLAGGAVSFPVRAVGIDPNLPMTVTVTGAGSGTAALRADSKVVLEDYRSVVAKVRDTSVYGNYKYVETRTKHDFDSYMFDVILTPGAVGDITVTVAMGDYSVSRVVSVVA